MHGGEPEPPYDEGGAVDGNRHEDERRRYHEVEDQPPEEAGDRRSDRPRQRNSPHGGPTRDRLRAERTEPGRDHPPRHQHSCRSDDQAQRLVECRVGREPDDGQHHEDKNVPRHHPSQQRPIRELRHPRRVGDSRTSLVVNSNARRASSSRSTLSEPPPLRSGLAAGARASPTSWERRGLATGDLLPVWQAARDP